MTKHSAGRPGFTLVEILVVLGILAILAAILLPVLVGARNAGFKAQCVAHMKQLLQASAMYATDNGRRLVPARVPNGLNLGTTWCVALKSYYTDERMLTCPADPAPQTAARSTDLPHSFGINYDLTMVTAYGPSNLAWSLAAVPRTSDLILFFDMRSDTSAMGSSYLMNRISRVEGRHNQAATFGFLDGHAKVQPPAQINSAHWWAPTAP